MKTTREVWLINLAERLNAVLFKNNPLVNYRITCGWPSGRALSAKNRTVGQCFDPACSDDKTTELIVSMCIDDPMRVADILAHEMVHGIVGTEHGHKGPFRKLALEIGLTGKMTATTAGEAFKQSVAPILESLGPYPHAKLDHTNRKKQTTRLIKCECEECGYNVRITRKWLEEVGAPHCPIHGEMITSGQ